MESAPAPEPVTSTPNAPRNRRMRAAGVVMALSLVALAASAILFSLPVANAGVQDCGAPVTYLLGAKSNAPLVYSDGTAINGWTNARLKKAYESRCSVLVGRRAIPAGLLLSGFWVLALGGVILGWTGRRAVRKKLVVPVP